MQKMDENDCGSGNFFAKGRNRKPCSKRSESAAPEVLTQNCKQSVFGKWLKDFRSAHNKESKTPRPLVRTLSANVKDKDRRKKVSRTLSASHKDRKSEIRREENSDPRDWDSGIFNTRNRKCLSLEGSHGYKEDTRLNGSKQREKPFVDLSPDAGEKSTEISEINRSALVSYLDEEGLKKIDESEHENNSNPKSLENARHAGRKQDGIIMPASALPKKPTAITNHYENRENFYPNKIVKSRNLENGSKATEGDYSITSHIKYPTYKPEKEKVTFNYYNDHRYENLETTDYISWSNDKDVGDKFEFELEEERICGEKRQNEDSPRKTGESVSQKSVECGFQFGFADGDWCRGQDVPEAPARDPSSLKSIKYGPGHEKYPSWPGSVGPETGDKPQRSHSWTEQTNYPKEKVTSYARPQIKRINPTFTQQLKTVMERCEKITTESFQKTMDQVDEREKRLYLPMLDREGKSLGDQDYMVPSPPERDKPSLTQADIEKYYHENHMTKIENGDYSMPFDEMRKPPSLTQADLEEYSRSYDDVLKPLHQHQGSYAQSEGYHSYVSSSELTTTPFLDRLRRDSDSGIRSQNWNEEDNRAGRDSVVTTSSGSVSSSETLKWHGSMSDVSVASSSCRSRQLIAHSSRVPPPQRHHSESVLYLGNQAGGNWQGKGDRSQQLKLFPVKTYTVQPNEQSKPVISPTSVPKMSVAERISELEKQQLSQRYAYYDPEKRHKVSDPTLKAIQKKALLSFYERHQQASNGAASGVAAQPKRQENWKAGQTSVNPQGQGPRHEITQRNGVSCQPPARHVSSRRASYASDVNVGSWNKSNHAYSCSLIGPAIIGPSISIDDWVPELPPKKPHLRTIPPPLPNRTPSPIQVPPTDSEVESTHFHISPASYERMPTPDLPPPPPPPATEDEIVSADEPLPPPPPEVEWHIATAVPRRSTPVSSGRASPQSPDQYSPIKDCAEIDSSNINKSNESVRSLFIPEPYEIQYDQNAINAILESNRMAELQKKKHAVKGKNGTCKQTEEKPPLKVHIENRPPLPLPRDVQLQLPSDKKQGTCDLGTRHKLKENRAEVKPSFVRSFSKPEHSSRTCMKTSKTEANVRSSLRHSSKTQNGKVKDRHGQEASGPAKNKGSLEHAKPFAVKKVSEYECRLPSGDRDGLKVFETTTIDDAVPNDTLQTSPRSNSKAAFLALRREKEMGMTNCEGSYKLTLSQSGERIETTNNEKSPLELVKMKEKSTENLVLDNRLPLEPPDLIPKISNLNRKSSSVQDVRDNMKKYDCSQFGHEKYRLVPGTGKHPNNRTGIFSENIMESECKVAFGVSGEEKTNDGYGSERIPVATVECVRAIITKLENVAPGKLDARKEHSYHGSEEGSIETEEDDKYGVSFTLGRTESDGNGREKIPSLLRVRSNVEKRLNRADSVKSNEGKVERSKSLNLVERSTSFGRSDTMRVIGVVEKSETRNANLSVSDASSQTDLLEEEVARDERPAVEKSQEELECERLSRDLASQLSPSDKLQSLLVPDSERKKPTDYVAGLFRLELSSKPRRQSVKPVKSSAKDEPNSDTTSSVVVIGVTSNDEGESDKENSSSPPSFITSQTTTIVADHPDRDLRQLQKKKEELVARLDRKLIILKEEQEELTNESANNEELGVTVANSVAKSARPHEFAKYRLHVEEVGKITSLLLGLSGRLAKVENALLGLPSHHDDRKVHESKRDKLQEQLAEAKQLKENIDRRSDSVAKTLSKSLTADEYADYVHFIRMKAKLIVDLREIADKISLGEEQLAALKETLSSS